MKTVKKSLVMLGAAIAILFFVSVLFGMNASGEDNVSATKSAYYHEMEDIYRNVLSEVLAKKGYGNAGINISSIIEANGSREYTVKIHHDNFERMDADEKQEFIDSISYLKFTDPDVQVNYEILL